MDFSKLKLIIWDLDDTFWKGTLSEGEVEAIDENIRILKMSTNKGIINSICSKNNKEDVDAILEKWNISDLFVFNSIDWSPKGERVKMILCDMGLRSANTLFIDDNEQNLNEVSFYNEGIHTATPAILHQLAKEITFLNTSDERHVRLRQYKNLEKKVAERKKISDNEQFLYSCDLKVKIQYDCEKQLDRIYELVQRANQLNYTKIRSSKDDLFELFQNNQYETGYVVVSDRFGDYGVVGFFAIANQNRRKLLHFLFSCRTIGQGIEQYVYARLGYPVLEVKGDVINMVDHSPEPGWINQEISMEKVENRIKKVKLLFKGPCDLMALTKYISSGESVIDTEFTYVGNKNNIIESHNHSVSIRALIDYSEEEKRDLLSDCCFLDDAYYQSKLFSKEYDFVFLSSLQEPGMALYQKNNTSLVVPFANAAYPLTDSKWWKAYEEGSIYHGMNVFTEKYLKEFSRKYTFIGTITPEQYISNLDFIVKHLNEKTKIIVFLGSEMPYLKNKELAYKDRHLKIKVLNDHIRKYAIAHNDRVLLLDVNDFLSSQDDFHDSINHFSLNIYYKMSQVLIELINQICDSDILQQKGKCVMIKEKINIISKDFIRIFIHNDGKLYRLLQAIYRKIRL